MEIASQHAEYPASIHHSHHCATSSHDESLDADFETRIEGKPCGSETFRTRSSSLGMECSVTWEERRGISAHEAFFSAEAIAVDRNSPTRRKCMPRDMAICINFQGTSIDWTTLHLQGQIHSKFPPTGVWFEKKIFFCETRWLKSPRDHSSPVTRGSPAIELVNLFCNGRSNPRRKRGY